jgi:gamma-glutamylcysteine synthetase
MRLEELFESGPIQLNLSEVRRKNGAIGTQGVSDTQVRDVLTHVAGMQVAEDASMRDMIEAFKADSAAQDKLRAFFAKNPMQGYELPDGTIQIKDGHHRAFLLDQAGDKTVPAVIKDYTGPSR